jgi:EpsI family protein
MRIQLKKISWPYAITLLAIIAAGVCMQALQRWVYSQPVQKLAVSLADYPREVGSWNASSVGLDKEIEDALHLEDFWAASYTSAKGDAASLLIAYYSDEAIAKLHQPTVCYPAAGWAIKEKRLAILPGAGNGGIRMNQMIVERGENRQMVLYWFHYPGATMADPSISKLHRLKRFFTGQLSRSMVKVQISLPIIGTVESRMKQAEPFVRDVVSILDRHLGSEWAVPTMISPSQSLGGS